MADQTYEPIDAIAVVIKDATGIEPTCGEGQDLQDFLETKATAAKSGVRLFVAYNGFTDADRYASGYESDGGAENYTLYIQTDKNLRAIVNKIRAYLNDETAGNADFTDTSYNRRMITATGGAAMREKGFGVFEMNIRIL